ncbi:MAG: electron transfer flavoprotein subunit alpha/FixB family protein [Nocardioidaceae bacterium]
MTGPITVVGRDVADATSVLAVFPTGEPVRVVWSADWKAGSQPAVVGRAVLPVLGDDSVVVLGSGQDDRDLAGWLSIRLDAPVIWAADSVRRVGDGLEVDRTTHGGRVRVVQQVDAGPAIVLAKPAAGAGTAASADRVATFELGDDTGDVEVLSGSEDAPDRDDVPLARADVVVSVGRGIGGPERLDLFAGLARRLGGALGASRVVVDSGWLPFAHQVGQTGTSVAPTVYLAFGISGAVQHQAGMRGSQVVVAVNTDRDAPLCQVADLVVEADAVAVASALVDRLDRLSTEPDRAGSYS